MSRRRSELLGSVLAMPSPSEGNAASADESAEKDRRCEALMDMIASWPKWPGRSTPEQRAEFDRARKEFEDDYPEPCTVPGFATHDDVYAWMCQQTPQDLIGLHRASLGGDSHAFNRVVAEIQTRNRRREQAREPA
jgi:hypothetical protein